MTDSEVDTFSIAVGIPTMNCADTIEETLASLVDQTRPPDRIIVIDASTDRTPEIVRSFSAGVDVPIEVHEQSDRGRGVGAARQDMYELLTEDVLACLDTQKRVGEDWIETRLRFHAEHPEYGVLSGARTGGESTDRPAKGVKDPYYLRQSNCSITKAALDRVDGWDPWMARGEDWDLRIRLWRAGVRSWVKSDLACEFIEVDDPTDVITKIFERPSSVDYLRKYGVWYARFHPVHVLGDVASLGSLVLLVVAPLLAVVGPPTALGLLVVPALGAATYLYMKSFRNRRRLRDFEVVHLFVLPRFFVLGVTALRQLLRGGDHDWNYGGFEDSEG
jgi:cellulose synthase/poly-beta-1,6-N-acetylglucosamine synthase-like glycosyltransferase